jgi:phytoene dehydrogenase-like protein
MRRGHEVFVLEASGRPGGHVRTVHDPLADGLYADVGAEHFYYPGYNTYWRYMQEFGLQPIAYPRRDNMVRFIGGKLYTEEDLHSKASMIILPSRPSVERADSSSRAARSRSSIHHGSAANLMLRNRNRLMASST